MRYLLDTDTCVFWLRGSATVRDRVSEVGPAEIAIATATLAELYYGAACSARPEHNRAAVEAF